MKSKQNTKAKKNQQYLIKNKILHLLTEVSVIQNKNEKQIFQSKIEKVAQLSDSTTGNK